MKQQDSEKEFALKRLPKNPDERAPDGSEIRLLPKLNGGGLCHCTLLPKHTSIAVAHKTVEEIWYFLQGVGQVWRKRNRHEEEVGVHPSVSLSIPIGTHFHFATLAMSLCPSSSSRCRLGPASRRRSESRTTGPFPPKAHEF